MRFLPAAFLGICITYLLLFFVQRCKRFHRRKSGDLTNVGRVARVWVETKWGQSDNFTDEVIPDYICLCP